MIRLFRLIVPIGVFPLLLSEALLVVASYFAAAYILTGADPSIYFLYEGGLKRLLFLLASFLLGMYFHSLYSRIRVRSRIFLFQQIIQVLGFTLIAEAMAGYASDNWSLPLNLTFLGSAFSLVVVFAWRIVYGSYRMKVLGAQRILFVGANDIIRRIAEEIEAQPDRGYAIAGYLDDDLALGEQLTGGAVLGRLDSLSEVAAKIRPHRVVVGLSERRAHMPVAGLLELRLAGVKITEVGAAYELFLRRICSADLQPARLIFQRDLDPPPNVIWMHDLFSRMLAAFLCVLLLPGILLLYLLLRVVSGQRPLLKQSRVGRDGRTYQQLRFRPVAGRVGEFYQRFHLNGIPELWNVIQGDMSLVGPESEQPEFARVLSEKLPFYDYRHNVRPGMTGWANINVLKTAERDSLRELEYDLYYIKHLSVSLNAYIFLHSLKRKLAGVV